MVDEQVFLLEQITQAFADGDEERGYELIAEAIERHEMPCDIVARALSTGLEASGPVLAAAR